MTTSYELSMKLKEAGVEQTGLFHWCDINGTITLINATELSIAKANSAILTILCRALTLGEIVRELPSYAIVYKTVSGTYIADIRTSAEKPCAKINPSPEEAAGELLLTIKTQSK